MTLVEINRAWEQLSDEHIDANNSFFESNDMGDRV